jgi:hypothetical protein
MNTRGAPFRAAWGRYEAGVSATTASVRWGLSRWAIIEQVIAGGCRFRASLLSLTHRDGLGGAGLPPLG